MQFDFTDEQEALANSVREVLARECPMTLVREVVEKTVAGGTSDAPMRLWQRMVELGWPALTIPEAYGGLGLGAVELALISEELGRAVAPTPFLATVAQFVPTVIEAANDDQKARLLGAIAAGGTGTLAIAEDDAGADWSGSSLEATAVRDGDHWVLDGVKRHVVDAASVDVIAVAARVDTGVGLFVVDRQDVRVDPINALDASRGMATVTLDAVSVPADNVLGTPGSPATAGALARAVEVATAALSAEIVGTCQAIFDTSLAYAKVREQFGVPIGSFQAMKHKYADMLIALEKARVCAYYAALTIAEDDDRRALAVAMAKAAAGDCQRLLTQEGIQTLGGIGYTWEHDMHLYVKRAKSGESMFGATHHHRARVADLIGLR
jgi:alkylation response protein AidB-like acyl-CoA dehydrogenase